MATIIDVAKHAGVSVATVSRVLNGKARVQEDLKQRVLSAVEALSYVPNPTARNLRRNESRTILILVPNLTNTYYTHIIAGISEAAHEHGYSSFLCNTDGNREREEQLLSRLGTHQADGAILMGTELGADWLKPWAQRYPLVQTSEYDPSVDIPHVSVNSYRATRDVMDFLLSLGHERIGLISSANRFQSTAQRTKGYTDALSDAGIPFRADYIRPATVDYSFKSGMAAARSLLSLEARPTALFCISDMLALAAITCAKEMGFRVPEDVTVVGFDDVESTTMFHPYVTTVVQPCYDMGRRAVEMLIDLLHGSPVPREVTMPHSLVKRESSAPRHPDLLDLTACILGR